MTICRIKKDIASVQLYRTLPNASAVGLWLIYFPSFLRYKISGKNNGNSSVKEEGTEGFTNLVTARTIHFDRFINESIDKVEQFIVMGAGYDTRCYGDIKNNNLKFFELDQSNTQRLKIDCLQKAGIDISHVTFVEVDFSTDKWYEKLENAGYDPSNQSFCGKE